MDITTRKQTRIVTLHKPASFSQRKITETVSVSFEAVNRILKQSKETRNVEIKARLQSFTVLFSFSAILVCFIDAQIHSCFREKISEFERQ